MNRWERFDRTDGVGDWWQLISYVINELGDPGIGRSDRAIYARIGVALRSIIKKELGPQDIMGMSIEEMAEELPGIREVSSRKFYEILRKVYDEVDHIE